MVFITPRKNVSQVRKCVYSVPSLQSTITESVIHVILTIDTTTDRLNSAVNSLNSAVNSLNSAFNSLNSAVNSLNSAVNSLNSAVNRWRSIQKTQL